MSKKRVQKLITFSPQLYSLVEQKAKKLGITFPEYIRSLAVEDLKDNDYIVASPEMERQIGIAMKEFEDGNYVELDPDNPEDMKKMWGEE
jgi:hypothetical protein